MDEPSGRADIDLGALLPGKVNGWEANESDKLYDSDSIFDYIDGAGEVYRSFNFRKLLARDYTRESQPKIIADLFDMGDAKNAFGVFTHDLEGTDMGIGQGSTYKGGLLSFWKGRFFVSLYAEEETEESKKALLSLGREVAAAIKQEGERPVLLSYFPQQGLKEKKTRFFYDHMILNYHFFVADGNILHLGQKTEAALAEYEKGSEKYRVLLVQYHAEEDARKAEKSFIQSYMPEARDAGILQTENGRWTSVRNKEQWLIVVFDALSESDADGMIDQIEKQIGKDG